MAFMGAHCRGGALLLPKSLVVSQSSTGAVELRPYSQLTKFLLQPPICAGILQLGNILYEGIYFFLGGGPAGAKARYGAAGNPAAILKIVVFRQRCFLCVG